MYDWARIRIRYESGDTAYSISKDMGGKPTRQAIAKRAAKEQWASNISAHIQNGFPILAAALNIDSRKMTDELLQTVLGMIGMGSTEQLACQAAGIHPTTWIDWKNKDVRLQDAVHRARAGKLSEWISRIDQAGNKDWKANQALLQAAPETRGYFGKDHTDNKIEIVINIDRGDEGLTEDGQLIEGEPVIIEDGEAA